MSARPHLFAATPGADRAPLELRLLGPLEVRRGSEPVPLGGARPRALLALLCLHRGTVTSQDALVDELWGESPPATARHMVEVYVSKLRKILGAGVVITQAPGYVLKLDSAQVDVARFESLLAEGRGALAAGDAASAASTLADALALWRGPALADFTYEPFAQAEITRLEELRLLAEQDRIEAELALGNAAELIGRLEQLIAGAPFREGFREQLMLALYRAGRQADALAAYRAARATLNEELGVEPGPALRRLERAILAHEESLMRPPELDRGRPDVRETRRLVTVVFADVGGGEAEPDPEALRPVLERGLERAQENLRRHGATVERVPDGTVMAVFGSRVAHEDDAERSLSALAELRDLGVVSRAGVATGEVLAGREATVRGQTVRTAARLLARASPNEVLADEPTRRLAAGSARFEAAGLDGGNGWRLLTVARGAGPRPLLLDTPVVGRRRELAELHDALARTAREGRANLVVIVGEPGIGKSRLAREFRETARREARVLTGRCLAYGDGITYWPLREVIGELAPEDTVRALEEFVAGLADGERIVRRLGAAVGVLDEVHPVEEVRWAARRLFGQLARERPLVLVFDDVHWAEPTFLDLVHHVVTVGEDAPILVLCLARPELLEEHRDWEALRGEGVMTLEPLSDSEAEELVARRDPAGAIAGESRARILDAAGGNPLFLEQLVAFSAQPHEASGFAIPPTLQALLAARLDRLGPAERVVVECAAVIGRDFWAGAVAELVPPEARRSLARHLDALRQKALLEPDESALPFERTFRFRHVLIQEAAYRSVTKERRADLHERLVGWLERAPAAVGGDRDEIVGYHLEQAYGSRAQLGVATSAQAELGNRAARHLARAGERAYARGDMRAAVNLLERGHALIDDTSERLAVCLSLARALDLAGNLERAIALAAETIESAAAVRDVKTEWLGRLVHASLSQRINPRDWPAERTVRTAEEAVEVFKELGDDLGLARAWDLVCNGAWERCRWDEGMAASRKALEHARLAGDEESELHALRDLLFAMYMGSTPVRDVRRETEAFLERIEGLPGYECEGLLTLAGLHGLEGARDEARALYIRAKSMRAELGHEIGIFTMWAEEVALVFDDGEFAERELRAGYDSLEAGGETAVRSTVAAHLAEALYLQGRYDEAGEFAEVALQIAAEGDVASQARGRALKGRVLARAGEHDDALRLAREAVDLVSATDDLVGQGRLLVVLAEVLALGGRAGEAAEALRTAIEISDRKGNVVTARKARALLAELGERVAPRKRGRQAEGAHIA